MAGKGRNNTKKKPAPPVRVAIVGGGCAGLAAAWQLSQRPGYEIAVYERSWRLGGKGASGRDGNGRIHEHGLHIWLGFYDNAFGMMRECYQAVQRNTWGPNAERPEDRLAHGSMDEAFFAEPHIGVATRDPFRTWAIWSGYLPPAEGLPGDDDPATNPFTLQNYLLRCYELLKTLLLSVVGPADGPVPGEGDNGGRSSLDEKIESDFAYDPMRTPEEIVAWSARLLRGTTLTAASVALQAVRILQNLLERAEQLPQGRGRTFQLITAVLTQTRNLLRDVTSIDPVIRLKMEVIDIVITIAAGLYRDRVLFAKDGFDSINCYDYREWLQDNGINPSALHSDFLTGIYDLTFAYEGGDRSRPSLAAGVALRGALRMFFTYRGSMFWRMRSGMGDAVFAPLYKVLLERKVTFHFRHALESVDMAEIGGERYLTALHFRTTGAPARLDDLGKQALDHFGCWPDGPERFQEAVAAAAEGTVDLTAFDAVIFATGPLDFFEIGDRAGFLAGLPAHWRTMRVNTHTAATQSAQVWLAKDLEQLGWYRGSGIVTALQAPCETWADMTHTLETERAWRAAARMPETAADRSIRSVAYFCGVLADRDTHGLSQAEADAKVQANLDAMLARDLRPVWPEAFAAGADARGLQVGPSHVQANMDRSDRYTLSPPDSIQFRISPLDRSVANMTVAGDWTASGLDAGCVEAAVMSGMLAAYAISGDESILDSIVGYDHP